MQKLNQIFNNKLNLSINIFNNKYSKKYFYNLVSSQVDMDRLDYLKRDSFYTGVNEGNIGVERIINMMNVVDERLVIEEKGIHSIEKFLFARRLMYWQVYLQEIKKDWFVNQTKIGICGATSTPRWLMEDVQTSIHNLFN